MYEYTLILIPSNGLKHTHKANQSKVVDKKINLNTTVKKHEDFNKIGQKSDKRKFIFKDYFKLTQEQNMNFNCLLRQIILSMYSLQMSM